MQEEMGQIVTGVIPCFYASSIGIGKSPPHTKPLGFDFPAWDSLGTLSESRSYNRPLVVCFCFQITKLHLSPASIEFSHSNPWLNEKNFIFEKNTMHSHPPELDDGVESH